MGGAGRQWGGAALLLFVLLLSFAAFPFRSAATTSPPKKQKGSTPPPPTWPPTLPPYVDVGGPRRSSSAVFPLYGDVYPHGLYYVAMNVGVPPKPYFLDVDSGSDLTWLQCNAPCVSCYKGPHPLYQPSKKKLVPCKDPLCMAVRASTNQHGACESPTQCDYEIHYADHGSSFGVLISDAFALRLTNGSVVRPSLAFGCGYDQGPAAAGASSPTDGMLGLGSGASSVPSQLRGQGITRNVIGHCLSRKGGGYLFFGDDLVPNTGVTWAPMSRTVLNKHYSPGPAKLFFGKQSLGIKEMPLVFDSGSSYTYFALAPYQALVTAVKKDLTGKPLEACQDPTLPLCWKGTKPFKSLADVGKYFKSLVLSFVNGNRAYLEVPPENYLIITKYGNACFGILNGTEVGLKDLNIIGDISLQDLMVVYDNEGHKIGWTRTSCDRLPNADENGGFEEGFCQPQFASMGILTEEVLHPSPTVNKQL